MAFTKSLVAALVAALAVSAAAAEGSRKTLELTADAAAAEMELGFDSEGARRRALQGEYVGNGDWIVIVDDDLDAEDQYDYCLDSCDYPGSFGCLDDCRDLYGGPIDGDAAIPQDGEEEDFLQEDLLLDPQEDRDTTEVIQILERRGGGGGSF